MPGLKLIRIGFTAAVLFFCSCSVQKREYRQGYYISFKKQHSVSKHSPTTEHKRIKAIPVIKELKLENDNETTSAEVISNNSKEFFNAQKIRRKSLFSDTCGDLIVLKNGDEIKAKVLEINDAEIKYKRCDNLNGPLIVINKWDVFMINIRMEQKKYLKMK